MKNRNKGITLISLVITIVIMLILTGITINLLFGDNGLITKTKLAKKAFLGEDAKQVVEDRINAYIAEKGPEGELNLYDFWYMYNGDSNLDTYDEDFVIYLFEEDGAISFTPSVQVYTRGTRYTSAVVIYKGYQMTVDERLTVGKQKALEDLTREEVSKLENESIYTLNPNGWTNGDVTVSFMEKEGSTVYYGTSQDNMPNTGNITCSTNTKYYYKYMQGAVVGDSGEVNVDKIDKENPTINTNLTGVVSGENDNDIDLSIGVTDTLSGYSKVVFKHKLSSAASYTNETTVTGTTMNGSQKGATVATTVQGKIEKLSSGTYNILAEVYDVAGNCVSSNELTKDIIAVYPANTPKISDGMVPVKWSAGNWVVCSTANTNNEWYEYKDTTLNANSSNWANVMLMDGIAVNVPNKTGEESVTIAGYNNGTTYTSGETISDDAIKKATREELNALAGSTVETEGSMFVWIPRYEYKVTPKGSNSAGTIDVNFVSETSTSNSTDYIIHPAFTANINNGGWSSELPGIWVAKYEAGFQDENTQLNPAIMSSKAYTTNTYTANALGQNPSTKPNMTYPVFKKNKYSYNCINIGDMYTLCQELDGNDINNKPALTATSFYGLSSSTTDSHLMKNSEWGAVAYLAHSKYGRNGTEVEINSFAENNSNDNSKYAKTGYISGDSSSSIMSTGSTSTTGNMTGIFDLSGGCLEYVAAFNGTDVNNYLQTYGSTFAGNSEINISTKYATRYNNTASSTIASSTDNKTGDATYETEGWNSDASRCAYPSAPFFIRGGNYSSGSKAGIFASYSDIGFAYCYSSFRPVLVAPQ